MAPNWLPSKTACRVADQLVPPSDEANTARFDDAKIRIQNNEKMRKFGAVAKDHDVLLLLSLR